MLVIVFKAFDWIDADDDHEITKEEFCSDKVGEVMEKWIGKKLVGNKEEEFEELDSNNDGKILFKEFMEWQLKKTKTLE